MKKRTQFFKFAISIIISFTTLNSAKAEGRFYGGIDISRQELDLDIYSTTLNDGTNFSPSAKDYYETESFAPYLFAGFDDGKNLKFEVSYSQSKENKSNNSTGLILESDSSVLSSKSEVKTQTIGFDFKPYAKINDKFLAYGILGVSYNKLDIKEAIYCDGALCDSYSENTTKLAPAIGFGAEYFIAPNVALRTQFKYIHLNAKTSDSLGIKEVKSATNLNIGFGYYF